MASDQSISSGFCQCGCGRRTAVYTKTNSLHGHQKGAPATFVRGHNRHTGRVAPRSSVGERFYKQVVMLPDLPGCWLWSGYQNKHGYGQITVGRRSVKAHRVSWELHNGVIPSRLWVLHRCDNPACVNPEHLFLGTHADNVSDMIAKGRDRQLHGEANGNSVLIAEDVRAIRSATGSQRRIAAAFGVTQTTVYSIKANRTWRHVAP